MKFSVLLLGSLFLKLVYTISAKKQQPLVSVVMGVYDRPEFLAEAIDSILAQTYTNFEFLIADDGSTDLTTLSVLRFYEAKDFRVKLLWADGHKGLPFVMNHAYTAARGKYIAKMDSDDISLP